jgi:predicted RND superfamily exporter protein
MTLSAATDDAALARAAERFATALASLGQDPERLALLEGALFAWLPRLVDQLGQSLQAEPFGVDDLPDDLRRRWLSADGRARIEIRPAETLRDQRARRRFVRAVQAVAPHAGGAPVEMTEGGRAVIAAYRQAAATAVLAIVILLMVLLRRFATVVMVLAPLFLAAVLTVAATVVFELPFNVANVIVLPLLFGLGVASGLHIVLRARQAGPEGVLLTSTPRAVLFSALTTVGSFGALALSSHKGTASMGVLLTIAISLTLVCTLVVLPALLHEAGRRRPQPREAAGRAGEGPAGEGRVVAGAGRWRYQRRII